MCQFLFRYLPIRLLHTMPLLNVFKASAGSGKTWRLTVEYVKLLLNQPDAYRNTLAVTFTNKATAEMKERILNTLWQLSRLDPDQAPSDILDRLVMETGLDPRTIKDRAVLSLQLIIHDYGHFRVETIDSYFQSILRNLARELGIGTSLNIELNNEAVLNEAVHTVLDRSSEDPVLLDWISEYMEETYREGKVLRIDNVLNDFGKTIFKEVFMEKERYLREQLKDKHFLHTLKKELRLLQGKQEKRLRLAAERFFTLLENHGLSVSDFSGGERGIAGYFLKLRKGRCDSSIVGKTVQKGLENPEAWVTKTHKRRTELILQVETEFLPLLLEIEDIRVDCATDILTCKSCIRHLSSVGLLWDIDTTVKDLNNALNRFLLSDTNALLSEFISGHDTSFVFEKTGSEINHILFDEFQDTSRLQWETFKPILAECLANNFNCLVVGDEKQAIYRWRNGDWRILGNMDREMSASLVRVETLGNNFRSEAVVVDFNNKLFRELSEVAATNLETEYDIQADSIRTAYASVEQHIMKNGSGGCVSLHFLSKQPELTYEQVQLESLLKEVENLQLKKVRAADMAILVRNNKHIALIADYFTDHRNPELEKQGVSYDIISDEAFLLSSSSALQLIMTALRWLSDPENDLLATKLALDYQREVLDNNTGIDELLTAPREQWIPPSFTERFDALRQLPLHELVETLFGIFNIRKLNGQDRFLYTFMDKLNEYLKHHSSDLPSFIEYWDEILLKVSVPSGTGLKGIRILSIHKSKGLEYHTVLIPFCNWNLKGEKSETLWCEPDRPPYNRLCFMPVKYTEILAETIFRKQYKQETLQLFLDNMNVLYVAFTRAKCNLVVFGGKKESKNEKKGGEEKENKLTTISDLIIHSLKTVDWQTEESADGTLRMHLGAITPSRDASEKKEQQQLMRMGEDIPVQFDSREQIAFFRQSTRSKAFSQGWDTEGYHNRYIDRGKLYHRLFSAIRTPDDVTSAVNNLIHEGLLGSKEAEECQIYIQKALRHPFASDWFSGKFKLFNECSILTLDASGRALMKRPDRVMQWGDKMTVVDFKFGKPAAAHKRQVKEYMQLLTAMGHPLVEGYLWYVDEEQIVTV